MAFCTNCGAQRLSETDQFCPSCGSRHDVGVGHRAAPITAVPPPPPRTMAPPPMGPPPMGPPPMGPPAVVLPTMPPPPPSTRGEGAPLRLVLTIGGVVVAMLAAGFVGWHFFWPRGGAGSPEEAVENLMNAAAEQDPVAMLDMVSPAEVEGMDDVYDAARERAEDEGLVDGDGVTDALELEFSDLEFDVDELGDDLARVTLDGGRYDVSWDPAELPDRLDFLADESDRESDSGDIADLFYEEEPSAMTVKIDGRWYVSLLGTTADYSYRSAEREADYRDFDLARPDWDLASEDADPVTGETPEDVVAHLVDAVNGGHAEEVLANLPEDLVKPLRPYVPVIDDLQREGGWEDGEIGLSVSADDLDLTTEDLGDGRVKVVVQSGTFAGTAIEDGYGVGTGSVEIEGDCVDVFEDGNLDESGCASDVPIVEDLGLGDLFFVVDEVDGGYQLDPQATLVEYASSAIDGLTSDLVDQVVADLEAEVDGDVEDY